MLSVWVLGVEIGRECWFCAGNVTVYHPFLQVRVSVLDSGVTNARITLQGISNAVFPQAESNLDWGVTDKWRSHDTQVV